jgi:aryl-alcohol dehydrogenase-like predicted oxidoreductase
MPLDHFVTLGRSGLRVSPFALGCMTFGEDFGWGASVEESTTVLDRYIELGGNFLDTANGYTGGHSESIVGDHIGHDSTKRDRLVIATKFSANMYPGDPNGGGSNRKAVIRACEDSLRRLKTDYIDLYWLHNWDHHTPIEETMAALETLVQSGKVRYLGISDTPAWKVTQAQLFAQFRGWAPVIATQIEYSLVERTVEGELIPMARELGIGVVPWSPLAGGLISGKYTRENAGKVTSGRAAIVASRLTEKHHQIVDKLREIAAELDTTIPRVALAWVQARPGVSSTIIGARTLDHLEDNVKALELRLTGTQTAALDDLTTPELSFPIPFLKIAPAIQYGGTTINGESAPR